MKNKDKANTELTKELKTLGKEREKYVFKNMTEQKEVAKRLKESGEKYRRLFENMMDGFVLHRLITDKNGHPVDYILEEINKAAEKILSQNKKDIEGKKATEVYNGDTPFIERYAKVAQTGKAKHFIDYYPQFKKWYEITSFCPKKGYFGNIFRDITERKQNEKIQKVLYNISKAANSSISLKQLYPLIHQELGKIIDTSNFYIGLVDEKKDEIFFPYHIDERDDNFHSEKIGSSDTISTYVIKTGHSLLLNRKQYDKMIAQGKLKPKGTVTDKSVWLGVPLKIEDKTIGAMAVQSYTNPELYSEKDIGLLEFVSSQVATAIERKRTEEKIRYLSFHDALTGLYNRAYFEEELERYNFPRYYPLSVIMIDINGLKGINDTFGHHEGDKLLQHLASLLNSISRKGDVVARLGGDEFVILLPSTTAEQVHDFHKRIKKTCEEDNIKPIYLRPGIALGCVTQKGEYQNTELLLKEVDKRMYQDKNITR